MAFSEVQRAGREPQPRAKAALIQASITTVNNTIGHCEITPLRLIILMW